MNLRRRVLFPAFLLLLILPAAAGWVVEGNLSSPAPVNGNRFGIDLLMEGSTLIAGETGRDYGGSARVGAVVSFERNAAGVWQQTQDLTFAAEPAQSLIGRRFAMSGNTLLISASANTSTSNAGRVLVYQRSAPGAQWGLVQTLTGDAADEYFGNSVALEGDTAIVGADNAPPGTGLAKRGAIYIFNRSGGTWARSQKILAPVEASDWALFGSFVALSGDWLAVNARNDGPYRGGIRGTAGSTYLFRRNGAWTLHRRLVPDPEIAKETGWECTELKGGVLVIGAPSGTNPVSPFTYGGAAYIYTLDAASGTWSATPQKLPATGAADGANYGRDISVEGNRMVIGASYVQTRGIVYSFTRGAGGQWVEDGSISRSDLPGTPFFGERVVLHQGRIAVSAANTIGSPSAPGRVFVYAEGETLQATTGDSYAIGATNASMLGTVLSEAAAVPVTFDYGLTTDYGQTIAANPGTLQTAGAAQQVYLSVAQLLPQTTYHYRVRAGAAAGDDRTFTTAAFYAGLADAVDAPQLNWDTYSTFGGWQPQTATSFDGSDAARSATVPDGQYTTMLTTITGPGTLSFRWKVSSELNHDYLLLYVNGALQRNISGETAWEQVSYDIPAGRYLFSWIYSKDQSGTAGSDAGWVDTVVWTPTSGTAAWNAWRTAQFNAAQLNDAGISGPGADPDRDGLTNLAEAYFGTAPLSATSDRLTPQSIGDALHVSWLEPLTGNGVSAVPEWSPDGQTWLTSGQSAPGILARTIPVSLSGGTASAYQLTARFDATGQRRALLRLRCGLIP